MSTNPIKKSYYEILGVPEDASQEEIKKARDRRVKEYHPDLQPNHLEWATERTKELNEAYETLSDPDKRAQYDKEHQPHPPIPIITPSHIDLGLVEIGQIVQRILTIENQGGPLTKDPDIRLSPADSWLQVTGYEVKSQNKAVVYIEVRTEDDMIPGKIYQGEVTVNMDGVAASASIIFEIKVRTATNYSASSTVPPYTPAPTYTPPPSIPPYTPAPTYYRTSSSRHSLINVASIAIWPVLALFIILMILNIAKAIPKEPINVAIQIQPEDHLMSKKNGPQSDMNPNVFNYALLGICNINSIPLRSCTITGYQAGTASTVMGGIGVYKIPWTVETNVDLYDKYEEVISPNLKLIISVPAEQDWGRSHTIQDLPLTLEEVFVGRIHLTLLDIRDTEDTKTIADLAISEDGKIYQETSPIPSSWAWHFDQYNVLMKDSQFGQNSVHLKYRGFARGITVTFVQTETVRASTREGTADLQLLGRSWYTFICPAGEITISF